jgi:hypothetical protein
MLRPDCHEKAPTGGAQTGLAGSAGNTESGRNPHKHRMNRGCPVFVGVVTERVGFYGGERDPHRRTSHDK